MGFITEDFLLQSDTARYLYTNYASDRLVLDYHCHLLVQDIARNRRFHNLFEIWLEGDHYKWRAMRANGVRNTTAPEGPSRMKSFWPGPEPFRILCAILSTIGPISNCSDTSRLSNC